MKKRHLRWIGVLFMATMAQAGPLEVSTWLDSSKGKEKESTRVHKLFQEYYAYEMAQSPENATENGVPGYNDRWSDLSRAALQRAHQAHLKWMEAANKIDPSQLSSEDALSFALLQKVLQENVEADAFPSELLPVDQMDGIQNQVPMLLTLSPKASAQDYLDRIERIRRVPTLISQTMELMKEGLSKGITPPKVGVSEVPKQLEAFFSDGPITQNPLYEAFVELPDTLSETDKVAIRSAAEKAILESAAPAFKALHSYMVKEYVPGSRESIAWESLPNGRAWYAQKVREQTTTNMSADEIYALGLKEVDRIWKRMLQLKDQVAFKGSLEEWVASIKADPSRVHTAKKEFIDEFKGLAAELSVSLPTLFDRFPKLNCDIQAVPAFSEASQPAAYMMPGSIEQNRPSIFYANTYDLGMTPKWKMRTLFLHEATPGHHFQLTMAQENPGLPEFRKFLGYNAFIEGWALYAESLGYELGFFIDPYSELGQLSDEMMRAVRLVVDTGLHAKGWTRDAAIQYFKEKTFIDDPDATNEINRYIVWAGQALSYKIGQLKIRELRNKAESALGANFDVRKYHTLLLESGTLPLDTLEAVVDQWIKEQIASL